MTPIIKHKIRELALKMPELEICGFIIYKLDSSGNEGELDIYECANSSDLDHAYTFEISSDDYLRASGQGVITGVYHSHPGTDNSFSENDLEYIEEVAVPMYIYVVGTGELKEFIPSTYEVNLVGLPFIWGLYDCYGLVRNYFRQNYGIYLNNYDRDDAFTKDVEKRKFLLKMIKRENAQVISERSPDGFLDFGAIKKDDIILFVTHEVSRIMPVHFGIYQGDNMFLHHPEHLLSKIEFLGPNWMKRASHILRLDKNAQKMWFSVYSEVSLIGLRIFVIWFGLIYLKKIFN